MAFGFATLLNGANPFAQTITVVPNAIPGGTAGTPYSETFTASGGVAPYTFSNEVGRLPNGLSLTPAGALAGTPAPATVPFEIWATDANGREAKLSAAANVIGYTLTLAGGIPPGTVGQGYVGGFSPGGGVGPYTCNLAGGALPPGVVLNANCTLTGAPTAAGVFNFTVGVVDANGVNASQAYAITVNPALAAAGAVIVPTQTPIWLALLTLALAGFGGVRRRSQSANGR